MSLLSTSAGQMSIDQFLKLADEPIVVHTLEGRIIKYNKAFIALSGYDQPEMHRLNLYDFMYPKNGKPDAGLVYKKLEIDRVYEFYGLLISHSGNQFDVFIKCAPDKMDERTVLISFVKKVTSHGLFNGSIDSHFLDFPSRNPNPVLQVNSKKRLLYANESGKELLDVLNVQEGDLLPLNWREYIDELLNEAIDTDSFECPVGNRTYLFKHSVMRDTELIFIHGTDITEVKESQENLQQLHFELNNFLYRTHHDLKTPVTNLQGLIELAGENDLNKTEHDLLEMMRSSTVKMDRILNDLTKVIQLNFMDSETVQLNASHLLKLLEEDEEIAPLLGSVRLNMVKGEDIPTWTDKNAIYFILRSLLSNALQYKDPSKPSHVVLLTISTNGRSIKFNVQDNGPGIAPKVQPHIYDMFYRGNQSIPGNGMGLYIAQKSLKMLKGSIGMSTEVGKGSTFHVSIPALC